MTGGQYEEFIKISCEDQVRNRVGAGLLEPGQAGDKIAVQLAKMLPQGIETPGHFFYAVESTATGEPVGDLWFWIMKRGGREIGFIMDVQIRPEHRRHGFGTAALRAVERLAQEKGLDEIGLEVYGHNSPARALYRKLGYQEIGVSMSRKLSG